MINRLKAIQVYWRAFGGIFLSRLADLAFVQALSFRVSVMSSTWHRCLRGIEFLEICLEVQRSVFAVLQKIR